MRRLQFFLFLVGVGLFAGVVRRVGLSAIAEGLAAVGWSFLAIFATEILIDTLHTEGWRHCLPKRVRKVSRLHLLATRTAGFAVNALTPTATVGGEVVKGLLLRRWVPLADAFASVLLDKLSFAAGQALFLIVGVVSVFQGIPLNPKEKTIAAIVVAIWLSAVGAFFFLQRRGVFRVGIGALRTLFGASALLESLPDRTEEFDARVRDFLLRHRRDFALSVGFHLIAQAARTLQFWIALTALGFRPGLYECFVTAGGLVFIEATLFLVPAKLGVLEGGHVVIFEALGYGASAGLAVSFVLRLSELCSAALGLGALAWYQLDRARTQGPPEEAPAAPAAVVGRPGSAGPDRPSAIRSRRS
jgi:uncharacterized protein (TIRG00374 family)